MKPINFYIKRGDRLKSLRVTMLDGATPIDLTTATVVFRMQLRDRSSSVFVDNATVIDAVNGVVEYQWAAGTTDAAGSYDAEFEATFASGKTETYPKVGYIQLEIDGDLQAPVSSSPVGQSPYVTRLFGNRARVSPDSGTGDVTILSGRIDATVSSRGIINGLSSFFNNGADFGPDTPGTTTCGIQEAIHSLTTVAQLDGTVGGGIVSLSPGRFTCSGVITIPNQFNFELKIVGAGKINTQVLYTGVSDFITLENITGFSPAQGGPKPFEYSFRDVGFIYQQDASKKHLIYFKAKSNQGLIENCSFTVKQCLDFVDIGSGGVQGQGGGLLFIGGTPRNAIGVLGIRIDGGADNKCSIKKCDFYGLAMGILYGGDHGIIEDCMFVSCGAWWSNSGTVRQDSTAWTPISTPGNHNQVINNCLSVGGCIMLNDNIYEIGSKSLLFHGEPYSHY
jgi:hypothetical protein